MIKKCKHGNRVNCVFRACECIKRSSGACARMWCHGRLLLHAGVILSSCLAASRYLENDPDAGTRDGRECSKRFVSVFGICVSNDVFVSPSHLLDPFAIAMGAVLLMDAPSIVLAHTRTVEAVKAASAAALALAGGMATVWCVSTYVSGVLAYVLGLHWACMLLHLHMDAEQRVTLSSEGECLYALFNHAGILCIMGYAAYAGPPVVVVPGHPRGISELCGLTCHLCGVMCTEPVLQVLLYTVRNVVGLHLA